MIFRTQWLIAGALAFTAALTVAPPTAHAAEGAFDKTIAVNGPVLLSLNTGSGYIHVSPGSGAQVHIVGHVHTSMGGWPFRDDDGSPEDRVRQVVAHPPIEQAGNIITVGRNFNPRNIAIDYEVTAPRGTDLTLNTGSGDIRVNDDGGPVRANTGSGSITGTGLSAHVSLETGSGDIKADMLSPTDVRAQTGSGSVALTNVVSSLWAQTGSGDLHVTGRPIAPWKLETGSGSVAINTGGAHFTLDASTGSGSVENNLTFTAHSGSGRHHVTGDVNGGGPQVRIVTGSGDISIR